MKETLNTGIYPVRSPSFVLVSVEYSNAVQKVVRGRVNDVTLMFTTNGNASFSQFLVYCACVLTNRCGFLGPVSRRERLRAGDADATASATDWHS